MYSCPNLEPVHCSMSGSNCCFLPAYRFFRRQVRWSVSPICWRNFHSFVILTVKGFGLVCKEEVDAFLTVSCFFYDLMDARGWSIGPLTFLDPHWTFYSFWFTYGWSLALRNLTIILLACEMSAVCHSLNIHWHCISLGLEWKLTFSSPVATDEFSKFPGILSAVVAQHHLGFEIAQLEFNHLH